MPCIHVLLALLAALLIGDLKAQESERVLAHRARVMITAFEQGILRPGFAADGVRLDNGKPTTLPIVGTGPVVTVEPTKLKESVGVIELNGKDLASLGATVFPQAFALLDRRFLYMRIIGAAALEELSGNNGGWRTLQPPWDGTGNQQKWALEAKRLWIRWYSNNVIKVPSRRF